MDENKITLEFDEGDVLKFEIMGTFDVNGVEHIALLEMETEEYYLYRYIPNGDDFELGDIPEEEFDTVSEAFDELMANLEAAEE